MLAHRAQDLAQKYSQGTVFHEAKDRLLMVPVAPMAGAFINTSSSSSSLTARDRPPMQLSPQAGSQQSLVISMQSQSVHSSNNNLESSNSSSSNNGVEGESAAIDNNNNTETETVEDKRTTRGPITHDKGARGRWAALFERACSLLQRTSKAAGTSASSSGTGGSGPNTVASALVAAAVQSQQLLQAKAASKQGKGKASTSESAVAAANGASCSSSDLAVAQAILEEAAGLPSIVNAPGECFAETMRALLGELLVAVADARAWDAEVSDGKTQTHNMPQIS